MENEDQKDPSQIDPARIDQDSPPNLGEESNEPDKLEEGDALELLDPEPRRKTIGERFRNLIAPIYIKIILSLISIFLLGWFALSLCSSPNQKLAKMNYVIAIDPTWYPLDLKSKERNMTAFSEILLKEIGRMGDIKIHIRQLSRNRLFPEFEKKNVDGVLSVLLPPLFAHERPYIVSAPFYRLGLVLVVGAKNTVESLAEMKDKVVGLVGNARTELNINLYPDVYFFGYREASQAIVDLSNKKIDGVIMDSLAAKSYSQGFYAGKISIVKTPLSSEGISLILHNTEDSKKFLSLFDSKLEELRSNGEFARLLSVWQLSEEY
ncbi:MAG: transporter substrate-binding domain-containing protein [Parachlamydiaceae bacterium]|nr:transporter substrate-binding domain-containing protein [Parachlamydiaceae bacterium]